MRKVENTSKNNPDSEITIAPTPSVMDVNSFFPGTECLRSDEMRISFMGSNPFPPRRRQACTCIMVELGDGHRFFFDFGSGCLRNIIAMRVPIEAINDIFITHLHVDHFGDLPYLYTFAPHNGRYTPLRVTGPSGSAPEFGTKAMIAGMKQMTAWNIDSINIMPVGDGAEIEVNEFDWADDNGLCYDADGIQIRHWRRSHTKDGASAYRLDWAGLSFVWTGDGRPDERTIDFSQGADLFVTEAMLELPEFTSVKWGTAEKMFNYIMDTHHTPHYAAGYMMQRINPRVGVVTHLDASLTTIPMMLEGVRVHWGGPLLVGSDLTVINVTKDKIWAREAVVSESAENVHGDQVTPPMPHRSREEMQEVATRDFEIDPQKYYPSDAYRELVTQWPKDL